MTLSAYLHKIKTEYETAAVIGLGVSNTPLARCLCQSGVRVTVYDKKTVAQLGTDAQELSALGAEFVTGDDYLAETLRGKIVYRAPGIMPARLAPILAPDAVLSSEIEAFFEVCPAKIIGVTGSDGKTTTTSLIAELLKNAGRRVHVGGNIGTPLFPVADEISPEDFVVLELSSFQLISMTASPEIAVITNISPNHLDIHADYGEYVESKKNIFRYQSPGGRLVINASCGESLLAAKNAPGDTVYYSQEEPLTDGFCVRQIGGAEYIVKAADGTAEPILAVSDIALRGRHNVWNYTAAIAAVHDLITPKIAAKTAREFRGVEHRLELVREYAGVRYYNDSIASSPSRTIAGLKSFDQRVILIAGGKDKGIPLDPLAPELCRSVKTLILTGPTAEMIADAVAKYDSAEKPEISIISDFAAAVLAAKNSAVPGDIVLLSPACTSFYKYADGSDAQFRNFEERGKYFKELVNGF
ncbi:MAG: UDP-N-acetylmuramoyl-L-alanine--D-glutamate ligase [Oscillospiraceae bacterium]|jgi:UDP-N-acetylmuramoylalanine--D-glutamate ligase|nr:UDP-N-acetylmuramoyl-L-alanine--D-glutamate ligase [Oscillospiraceae bacterium]